MYLSIIIYLRVWQNVSYCSWWPAEEEGKQQRNTMYFISYNLIADESAKEP
jgi:hypothetical protein